MTQHTLGRRTFIETTAALGVATLLAGCAGGGNGDGGSGDESGGDESDGNGGDGNGGDGGGDGEIEFLGNEPSYDGWFDDVDNYEGTVDRTGDDEVRVAVGSEGGLSFTPAAVAVSPGTTVVWEWTGEGGDHNVAEADGAFQSDTVGDEGHTFEHAFEDGGVSRYACTPHEAVGMKGAVYVE